LVDWLKERSLINGPAIEGRVEAALVGYAVKVLFVRERGDGLGEATVSANGIAQVEVIVTKCMKRRRQDWAQCFSGFVLSLVEPVLIRKQT
jgi:hypothetical protein